MMFTLGLGSAISLGGTLITVLCDQFPKWRRWRVTVVVSICGTLVGLIYCTEGGLLMLDLIDHYGAGFLVYLMSILECIAIAYVYGLSSWCQDIEFMLGRKISLYFRLCWGFVLPVGLTVNLLYFKIMNPVFQSGDVEYPTSATVSGWLLTCFAACLVPGCAIHAVVTAKGVTLKDVSHLSFASRQISRKGFHISCIF